MHRARQPSDSSAVDVINRLREHGGPAPPSTRWTVLCLDLSYILSVYLNRTYSHVKGMRLCANMFLKNVFTSDILYDPGVSLADAKKMGGGRHMAPLPREFGFPVQKGDSWHDIYDLIRSRSAPVQVPKKQVVTKELPELDLDKLNEAHVHVYAHPLDPDEEMASVKPIGPKFVVIWNTSLALKRREVSIMAKAHTDVDITRMIVAPFDELRYACCRSGHVFEIDYHKVAVHHVRRLLPIVGRMKNGSRPGAGLAITSISMNETFCATGSEDGYLRLWPLDFAHVYLEAEEWFSLMNMRIHKGVVTGVLYSPNGEYLYSACSQGSLAAYSAESKGYPLLRILNNMVARGKRFGPDALAISSCGRKLAFVGPSDFTVTVVDSRHLSELIRVDVTNLSPEAVKDYVDTAVHVAFTPHNVGHLLVTTSNQRLLKLDETSGKLLAEVNGIHRVKCTALVSSHDGRYLVTAGDKVLKVWDYGMRYDINFQVFIGHSEEVSKVLYTPDHLGIISTGEAIYIWDNLALRPSTPPIELVFSHV
nr:hypothetical protein BaRGS_024497 [Batillaria attramentaria]